MICELRFRTVKEGEDGVLIPFEIYVHKSESSFDERFYSGEVGFTGSVVYSGTGFFRFVICRGSGTASSALSRSTRK